MKKRVVSFFFKTCPKTGRIVGINTSNLFLKICFPLIGITAILWYIVRVVPKPSRAAYPCQKASAAIAGTFITYLFGAAFWIKLTKKLGLARTLVISGLVIGFLVYGITGTGFINSASAAYVPPDAPNTPMGVGRGVNPGRVVWVYNPDATSWDGTTGYWWDDNNSSTSIINTMLDNCVEKLTSTTTVTAAWDAIFKYNNQSRGKGNVGYVATEKIAIKINCNNTRDSHAMAVNNINPSPALVLSLIRQLVNSAGVPQANITVYDASRYVTDNIYNKIKAEFPNVVVADGYGGDGRVQRVWTSGNVLIYSQTTYCGKRIPTFVADAEYIIDMPLMKLHPIAGVTLSQKNHYGTIDGLDHSQISPSVGMNAYSPFVDMMGSPLLGVKTAITILDGLYAAFHSDIVPEKWKMAPFNNDWPSSIFASFDQVAIDSVGLDFLNAERGVTAYSDNYLHEAALANNPPSGTVYAPNSTGTRLNSLGVHEHWNNSADKKYSRNLGTGNGIELAVVSNGMAVTIPTAPTALTAASIKGNSISLSWSDNANNEDKYNVYVSATATKPASPSTILPANSKYCIVSGLSFNTLYYFWVNAENTMGKSADAAYSARTAISNSSPAAPSGLTANAQTTTAIGLSWVDNSDDETSFKVYANTVNTMPSAASATLSSNVTSTVITGLTPSTLYYFWVTAANDVGPSAPASASATTLTPPPPDYLMPVVNSVALSGTASLSCDGNTATRWESTHGVDPQWIYWDLGGSKRLSKIIIDWEAANAATYTIDGSQDAANWTSIVAVTNASAVNHTIITNTLSGTYRYVRMNGTTRNLTYGYSIWEAYIYSFDQIGSSSSSVPVSSSSSSTTSIAVSSSTTSTPVSSSSSIIPPSSSSVSSSTSSIGGETLANIVSATALSYLGGNTAAMSFDKNVATRWESVQKVDPQWIYWDLGSSQNLTKIIIDWEAANAATYTIDGSLDATAWTTLASVVNTKAVNHTIITNALSGNFRYVRMNGTTRNLTYGYSIFETYIYVTGDANSSSSATSSVVSSSSSVITSSSAISSSSSGGTISKLTTPATPATGSLISGQFYYTGIAKVVDGVLTGGVANSWGLNDGEVTNGSPALWVYVDLGGNKTVSEAKVYYEAAGTRAQAYDLQYLPDGGNLSGTWNTAKSVTGNALQNTDDSFAAVNARYFRLYIANPFTSTPTPAWGLKFLEFEVYGY